MSAVPPPAPKPAPATGSADLHTVLIVDDSLVDRRLAGRILERGGKLRATYACDGAEALELIARSPPAVILTDLQMPRMDGLTLVEHVRREHPRVPVVLMTGNGSEEIAIEALRAGAASYVPKRNLTGVLLPIVDQVLAASRVDGRRARILETLSARASQYVLQNDPTLVQPLAQVLREELVAFGLCDATGATRAGIALEEALLNAMYHGNLDVSSDLKLAGDGSFERLAAERRGQSPYRERRVRVRADLTPAAATFTVEDEGPGFDVVRLPDPTAPQNLLRPGGRGVTLMRLFMDDVRFSGPGNCVVLTKRREPAPSAP